MARGPITAFALLFTMALLPLRASVPTVDKVTDANETAAVVALTAITTGQASYRQSCGKGGFAPSLVALHAFVDDALTSSAKPQRAGFSFSVAPGAGSAKGSPDCHGTQTVTKFYASAVPLTSKTGTKSFAVNENGNIWTIKGSKAPTEPFGPPASQIEIQIKKN
jgi:hypothetical protein